MNCPDPVDSILAIIPTHKPDPDLWDADIACPQCGHGMWFMHTDPDWVFEGCLYRGCECNLTPPQITKKLIALSIQTYEERA